MKVVECPECRGYVSVDADRCQNCGHWMKGEAPKPAASSAPLRENKFQRDLKNPRKRAFFVICLIITAVLFAVAIYFLLGMGDNSSATATIRFEVDASSEVSYTFAYTDSQGFHMSQDTYPGSCWFEVKYAETANLQIICDSTVVARAYINGHLVDQQSGTYVMISATP